MDFNLFLMVGCSILLLVIIIYFLIKYRSEKTHENVKYKNGIVKIPILSESEIKSSNVKDIVCIGQRDSPGRVRNIKVGNNLMCPQQKSSYFTWAISDDGKFAIIANEMLMKPVKIPLEKVVYTSGQCWGGNGKEITDESFVYHLKECVQYKNIFRV